MSGVINSIGSKSGVINRTELDYEEGTWTPISASGGGDWSGGAEGSVVKCTYVRIGKICKVTMFVYFPTTSNTNPAAGTGLPFPALATTYSAGILSTDFGTDNVVWRNDPPGWRLRYYHNDTQPTWANVSGKYFAGGYVYEIE